MRAIAKLLIRGVENSSAPSAEHNNRTKALECIRLIDELM